MILKIINKYLTGFTTQVLLFSVMFYAGCSSSNIETVDSQTIQSEHNDITRIFSFDLKNGKSFNDDIHNIYLSYAINNKSQIIYNGPAIDSLGKNITGSLYQSFSLSDVTSAVVQFKKNSNPLPVILGITAAIGIVALIFLANGERNKRNAN